MASSSKRFSRLAGHLLPLPTESSGASSYPEVARGRVSGIEPDCVVKLNYFDYEKWDKVTKPAGFNMRPGWLEALPEEVRKQAMTRM